MEGDGEEEDRDRESSWLKEDWVALRVLYRKLGFSLIKDMVSRFIDSVGGRCKRVSLGKGGRRGRCKVSRQDRELRKLQWEVNFLMCYICGFGLFKVKNRLSLPFL